MNDKPATWKPLDLEGIEEGRFIELANGDLRTLQEKLVAFVAEYKDRAEKATATMTITIALKCQDVESLAFGIKASTKLSLPQRPAALTLAVGVTSEEDGRDALYIRRSGSDRSSPRQGKFYTDDGRPINPDTGEPVEDGKSQSAGK